MPFKKSKTKLYNRTVKHDGRNKDIVLILMPTNAIMANEENWKIITIIDGAFHTVKRFYFYDHAVGLYNAKIKALKLE